MQYTNFKKGVGNLAGAFATSVKFFRHAGQM